MTKLLRLTPQQQQIAIALFCNQGEWYADPEQGSKINQLRTGIINNSVVTQIKQEVQRIIDKYDFAELEKMLIEQDEQFERLNISLTIKTQDSNNNISINN